MNDKFEFSLNISIEFRLLIHWMAMGENFNKFSQSIVCVLVLALFVCQTK